MLWKITLVVLVYVTTAFCLNDAKAPISGGNYISIKKAPYMASVRVNKTEHVCGGSIIHERFVLTSARCIVENQKYQVAVGTHNLHKGGWLYDVEEILMHPMYSNETFDNDICILKLNDSMSFGPTVDRIHLNDKSLKMKNGMTMKVTGWGCTAPQGNVTERLHQVKVRMVLRRPCRHALGRNITLTRSMICAGGNGRDACKGDDGGPLIWKNVQVGIVSFLAGNRLPRVYTKISEMLPWITDEVYENY
ncbi:unnamed protein product [Arctia plantaginis]|uniref:Peptidase S1 domain-containing protein n=1 Tax=Arctia plantaginis TaxID=874455 RepID=A0A8S0YM07_ARCPL|nr:unnamed protein product [Arctia plantaginis]